MMKDNQLNCLICINIALISIVFLLAWSIETIKCLPYRGLFSAFLSVLESVSAAGLVTLSVKGYFEWRRNKRIAIFKAFFGIKDNQRPILVLPRFKINQDKDDINDSGENGKTIKKIDELDKQCLSFDDVVAVRHIATMFGENFSIAPKIFFDNDVYKVLYGKADMTQSKYKEIINARTLIVIGLFSNTISTELNIASNATRFFKLSPYKDASIGNRQIEICRAFGKEEPQYLEEWRDKPLQPMNMQNDETFVLLSRMSIQDGRLAILVGGQSARGTRKLGSYLRANWQTIAKKREQNRSKPIKNSYFSIGFSLNNKKDSELRIEKIYYPNEQE